MAILIYKLPLIVIVAPGILNRQIGVRKSKYGVNGDLLFTGHVSQPNFGPKSAQKGLNDGDAHL